MAYLQVATTDIHLLCNLRELEEPFGKEQVGKPDTLIDSLRLDPLFQCVTLDNNLLDSNRYVERVPSQVEAFVNSVIEPIRDSE